MFKIAWKERSKGPPSSDNLFLGVVNVLLEPFDSEKACYCYCLLYIKHDINILSAVFTIVFQQAQCFKFTHAVKKISVREEHAEKDK